MTNASDLAELSTLRAQLDDVLRRVLDMSERYGTAESAVYSDLASVERSLVAARRSLEHAATTLGG